MRTRIFLLLTATTVAAFLLLTGTAEANHIPTAAVSCTRVSATWTDFPSSDTLINFSVTQPGSQTAHVVAHTNGARQGSATLPIAMTGNGVLTATVTSAVVDDPARVVTATADCRPPTTTTTVPPPTTTTAPPTTTVPPTTTTTRPLPVRPPDVVVVPPTKFTG